MNNLAEVSLVLALLFKNERKVNQIIENDFPDKEEEQSFGKKTILQDLHIMKM